MHYDDLTGLVLCGPVGRNQRFGKSCCLHLQRRSDMLGLGGIIKDGRRGSLKEEANFTQT
jgi:hypothetical protein